MSPHVIANSKLLAMLWCQLLEGGGEVIRSTNEERHSVWQRGGALLFQILDKGKESEKGKKFEMEEEIERCQREGLDLFVRALPSEHKSQEDFSALRKQKNFVTVNAYFAFSPPLRPNLTVVTYKVFPLKKNDLFYVFKNNLQSVRIVRKW